VALAVAGLLVFYVVMAFTASWQKGLSFDEGLQIAVGYNIWLRDDLRIEASNGDLVKRWASLPLLFTRPAFPPVEHPLWRAGAAYELALNFFYELGNDPRALVRQSRAMVLVFGVATGLLVFFCSRELFGPVGGLISLTIFVSSSSMLVFGAMVSTEMTVCCTLLGSVWCIWRLLHRITWGRLLGSLVFLGLLVLSKLSCVLILPLTAAMVVVKLAVGRPLEWRLGPPRWVRSRSAQAGIFAGLFALHALLGWAAIWAHYDFRYVASPNPADPGITLLQHTHDPIDPRVKAFFAWSRRTHFLPEAYLHGTEWILGSNDRQAAFMDGRWKFGGWRTFFPYAMWVKTHPSLILLLLFSLVGWWGLRRFAAAGRPRPTLRLDLPAESIGYRATPFFALVGIYIAVAITWNLNIGFRHALPIYPAAYVLAGALAAVWTRHGLYARTGIALLLGWHVSGPIAIYPHYLAYFSPVVGGPAQGYRHLVDSSLDWGMDLPGFKRWLDINNPGDRSPLFFAYFGVESPDYYRIKSHRLPGQPEWRVVKSFPLTPGIYAISATLLQSIGTYTTGPWNREFEKSYWASLKNIERYNQSLADPSAHAALLKHYPLAFWKNEYVVYEKLRFGRLCAWLRHHRPPDDHVGYSLLIWRLDAAEINAALSGPPAELADAPLRR
jgi:hypothetical protein